jgi:hypothetical protein
MLNTRMTNNPIHIIQGNKMKGSCLCGAMEYEIDSLSLTVIAGLAKKCMRTHSLRQSG